MLCALKLYVCMYKSYFIHHLAASQPCAKRGVLFIVVGCWCRMFESRKKVTRFTRNSEVTRGRINQIALPDMPTRRKGKGTKPIVGGIRMYLREFMHLFMLLNRIQKRY